MNRFVLPLAVAVLLVTATAAAALSLTNRGSAPQQVIIDQNDAVESVLLEPGQTMADICPTGCTITLEEGAQRDFEGYEVVYIEDGDFVLEE